MRAGCISAPRLDFQCILDNTVVQYYPETDAHNMPQLSPPAPLAPAQKALSIMLAADDVQQLQRREGTAKQDMSELCKSLPVTQRTQAVRFSEDQT